MVTLIKRCLRHGIQLQDGADGLQTAFTTRFPEARFEAERNEWVITWEKGHFAESNAVLEGFFLGRGETVTHIDEC